MTALILSLVSYAAALVFNGPGINLLLLTCSAAALLLWAGTLIWQDLGTRRLVLPSGAGPALMAVILGWMLLSSLWSSWPQISFFYALIIGAMPLSYLLWLKEPDAEEFWDRLWIGLLLLTLGVGGWGLTEYIATAQRANGPFLDPNAYGALFYLFFFPAFFRYLAISSQSDRRFWRLRAYETAFAILLAALFSTYSRGAIGAFVLMLPLALGLALKRYGRAAVPGLLIISMIGGAVYLAVATYPKQAIERNVFALSEDQASQDRLHIWRSTWEIYKDNPVLGTGLGTFKSHYSAYRAPQERSSSGDLAHNDYLQLLQEGGPLLLGFILSVGVMTLWLLYRSLRMSGSARLDEQRRRRIMESSGLLLGVLALFAHAMVNFIFYVLPLSLLAGLYLGQAYRQCAGTKYRTLSLSVRAKVARTATAIVLALPAGALTIDGITSAVLLQQPPALLRRILAPSHHVAYEFAQVVASLRPNNIVPALYLAGVNHTMAVATNDPDIRIALAQRARDEYVRALTITEYNAPALTEFAQLLLTYPALRQGVPNSVSGDPETLLRRAIRVEPTYEYAYLALAKLYEEQGEVEKAYRLLAEDAVAWFMSPIGSFEGRTKIVEHALELALQLDARDAARALATSLITNAPGHAKARAVLRNLDQNAPARSTGW